MLEITFFLMVFESLPGLHLNTRIRVLCRRTLNKNKKVDESIMDYRFIFGDNRASLWDLSLRPKILIFYVVYLCFTVKHLWLYCRPLLFLLLLVLLLSESIALSTELPWSFPWVIIHGLRLFLKQLHFLIFIFYFLFG